MHAKDWESGLIKCDKIEEAVKVCLKLKTCWNVSFFVGLFTKPFLPKCLKIKHNKQQFDINLVLKWLNKS